jgi:hypothetical protein
VVCTRITCVQFIPYRVYLPLNIHQAYAHFLDSGRPSRPMIHAKGGGFPVYSDFAPSSFSMIRSMPLMARF